MKYRVSRDVTPAECRWLRRVVKKGELVEEYVGQTFGVVSPNGTPVLLKDEEGFDELPRDALEKSWVS